MILSNRVFNIIVGIFLLSSVMVNSVKGQCKFDEGPIGEICSKAYFICGSELDGYKGTLRDSNSTKNIWGKDNFSVCGGSGQFDNTSWFTFIACSKKVHLRIRFQNCKHPFGNAMETGIQTGLYTSCMKDKSVACKDLIGSPQGIIDLEYDGFKVGDQVYFVIDGYSRTICSFQIEVVEGVDSTPVLPPDPSSLAEGAISGPKNLLCSEKKTSQKFDLLKPECKVNLNTSCSGIKPTTDPSDSTCYVWQISPSSGRYFVNKDSTGTSTNIVFTESGTYTISAQTFLHPFFGGSCASGACGKIKEWTVVVEKPDTIINPYISVCPGNSYNFNGVIVTKDTVLYDTIDPCMVHLQRFKIERNQENIMGPQYVCIGQSFLFQGINYSTGSFETVDSSDCSLVHKFIVENFALNIDSSLGTILVCSGTSFPFQGNNYLPGDYNDVKDVSDCTLLHKFKVEIFPQKENDLGVMYVCSGGQFTFQGKDYPIGAYGNIPDSSDCALSHKLVVEIYTPNENDLGIKYVCSGGKYTFQGKDYGIGTYGYIADSSDCTLSYKLSVEVFAPKINDLGIRNVCTGNTYLYEGKDYPVGIHFIPDTLDCALSHKLTIEDYPRKEKDLGTIYVCEGNQFSFQGSEYSPGQYAIQDLTDCALTNNFIVQEFPMNENDLGIKYICKGQNFVFQGKSYSPGDWNVKDTSLCDTRYRFSVKNIDITIGIQADTNTITCGRNTIKAVVTATSNGTLGMSYNWKDPSNTVISTQNTTDITKSGRFTVTAIYDASGIQCSNADFIDIGADFKQPTIKALIPVSRCLLPGEQNPQIVLSSSDIIASSVWTLPSGAKIQGMKVQIDSLNTSTNKPYLFSAISINGCRVDTSFTVPTNFEKALISLRGDPLTCYRPKDTILLTTNIIVDSIRWYKTLPQPAFYGSYPAKKSLEVDSPGTYKAEVLASISKCWSDAKVDIEDKIVYPEMKLQNDIKWNCNTQSVVITPEIVNSKDMEFEWKTVDGKILSIPSGLKMTAGSTGTYTFKVLDKTNGCDKTGELRISAEQNVPRNIEYSARDISCFGQKDGVISISNTTGGNAPYLYYVNGVKTDSNSLVNLIKGDYTLGVRDKFDCLFEKKVSISEPNKFMVNTPLEINIFYSETAELTFSSNYPDSDIVSIKWTNSKGEILGNDFDLKYNPNLSDVVNVEVTTINGCIATSKVKINVDNELKFYIPNIFSPNGDGINDKLEIFKNKIPLTLGQISIFDRYGNMVYNTKNYEFNNSIDGWDGTINGKSVVPGVYVLLIEYTDFLGERQIIKSDITVVK